MKETLRLGIVACPNDTLSRQRMERMIAKHPKETKDAMKDLNRKGIEFEKWWNG